VREQGMDRTIAKTGWSPQRWVTVGALGFGAVLLGWQLAGRANSTRLSVDSTRLTTAVVHNGDFLEYYPFDGTVEPATSVYLDVEEGGRVEEIAVEGGQHVEKGDLILRFSNTSLQRTAIDTETQLLYNLDIQRNTQFNRAESSLILKDTLLDVEHQILDATNKFRRYDTLMKGGNTAISVEAFETARNQLDYLKSKRALLIDRIQREDALSKQELAQTQHSIDRLNTSLGLLNRIVKSLEVRAPISGYLSTIDAQVGQNIPAGQRIGQIDILDKFKVSVSIDQYYISRVVIGTLGHVDLDGHNWNVKIQKVYPEVKDNSFQADVVFENGAPDSLKRGQTLTVELTFGSPSRTLVVSKGGFYQQTEGRWVYVVAKDGRTAHRVNVRLGRQNPREVEVLEGLRAGDRIITSSYDSFNAVDELGFSEPVDAPRNRS
jgi:HlyD family secretion protein